MGLLGWSPVCQTGYSDGFESHMRRRGHFCTLVYTYGVGETNSQHGTYWMKQTNDIARRDYKLFLDDFRKPSDIYNADGIGWTLVTSYDEFVAIIEKNGLPTHMSLDHDLADEHYEPDVWKWGNPINYDKCQEKTGLSCVKWLAENEYDTRGLWINVHSANPVGAENIASYLASWHRHLEENE